MEVELEWTILTSIWTMLGIFGVMEELPLRLRNSSKRMKMDFLRINMGLIIRSRKNSVSMTLLIISHRKLTSLIKQL